MRSTQTTTARPWVQGAAAAALIGFVVLTRDLAFDNVEALAPVLRVVALLAVGALVMPMLRPGTPVEQPVADELEEFDLYAGQPAHVRATGYARAERVVAARRRAGLPVDGRTS